MKQVLTLIYVIASAAFSVFAVITEMQPALFWMTLFAKNIGDTYPVVLVGLLTILTLMMPMVILLLVLRMLPQKPQIVDGPGIWIMRERQLQSALLEIPIYINDKKVGAIDMGRIKFFPSEIGKNAVSAGKIILSSEKVEFNCSFENQPYFKLKILSSGLTQKYVLSPMAANNSGLKN